MGRIPKNIINSELDNKIKDFKDYVSDKLNEKNSFVTEAGDIEKWRGNINEKQVDIHVQEVVDYLKNLKK